MTTLNVALIDQTLVVAEKIKIASGDIDSVALAVEFDSAWEEFVNRSASFYTSHDSKPIERLLTDNQCIVPPGVLAKPGILYVGIIGVKADGSSVKTSSYASFRIVQGAEHAYTTVSPELDLYQQYLKATKEETTPAILAMQAAFEEEKAALEEYKSELQANCEALRLSLVRPCDFTNTIHTITESGNPWTATQDCWISLYFKGCLSEVAYLYVNEILAVRMQHESPTSTYCVNLLSPVYVQKGAIVKLVVPSGFSGEAKVIAYGCL